MQDQTLFDNLMWLAVLVALVGNYGVVKKQRWGFMAWLVSNLAWIGYDIYKTAYPQAFMMFVFLGTAFWGWYEWGRPESSPKSTSPSSFDPDPEADPGC